MIATVLCLIISCDDKETEGISRITYYVDLELKGADLMTIPIGTTFTDPGVVATEGDNDISESVTVKGSVNTNKTGLYTLNYNATNVDGFNSSIERTVIVYDPTMTTDISGSYSLAEDSYRLYSGAKTDFSGYDVTITQLEPGIFHISDFFGGFYDQRDGRGSAYAMSGYIKLNADNTIELLSSHISYWGDSIDKMENAGYNPETGDIEWEITYVGSMFFYMKLTK
jgi:hypothetical protein